MNNSDKNISEKVKNYLDKNIEFTSAERKDIQMKIKHDIHKSRKLNPFHWVALASAVAIFFVLSISFLYVGLENQQGFGVEREELSVDLSDIEGMNIGAEMPRLLYANDNIAVIQGTFGVIVYNIQNSIVSNRISYEDIKSYDITMMVAAVSQDGTTIYIGNDDMSFSNDIPYTYEYNIGSGVIKEIMEQPSDNFIPKTIEQPGYNEEYDKYFDLQYLISEKIVEFENSFLYLRSKDWNMQNLQIVICQYKDGESTVFDVFK